MTLYAVVFLVVWYNDINFEMAVRNIVGDFEPVRYDYQQRSGKLNNKLIIPQRPLTEQWWIQLCFLINCSVDPVMHSLSG